MYTDTITVFNRYESRLGDMWYPTVLRNTNVSTDKSALVKTYGESTADKCVINIRYADEFVGAKRYLTPKEWDSQTNDKLADTITFTVASDFIFVGEFSEEPIDDNDFIDGFYNYMNSKYDEVYMITSVSKLKTIPHFEITAK